jgi:hypothetical protein
MSRDHEKVQDFAMDMDQQNDRQQAAATEGTMPSIAADRLYQLAALTAGVFLLATLL